LRFIVPKGLRSAFKITFMPGPWSAVLIWRKKDFSVAKAQRGAYEMTEKGKRFSIIFLGGWRLAAALFDLAF